MMGLIPETLRSVLNIKNRIMNTTATLTAEQNQLVVLDPKAAKAEARKIKAAAAKETKAIQAAEEAAANEVKAFEFEINQEGFSYRYQLAGKAKDFTVSTSDIVRNITGKLYSLLLIRKTTGQKCGISLSKDFNFSFIMGERTISTLQAQSQLNLKLKIGYKAEKRRSFEAVLSLIIDEVLRGSNLYTVEEVNALDSKLTALIPAQSN
jgi:hypothetical protein